MSFTAPCGARFVNDGNITYLAPPPAIDFSPPNTLNPAILCATKARTLTDADSVSVTSAGSVNPQFRGMPDGSPLPPAVSIQGLGVPQDALNAPTPLVELSASGTMEFRIPINFRDQTDTIFDGKFEGVLEVPYDARMCPSGLPGTQTDPGTGLVALPSVPSECLITTPSQYLAALEQGHGIDWVEYTSASLIAYGPMDPSMPASAQTWQRQSKGGSVAGVLLIPYATNNNSTVLRIGLRYSTGMDGQVPFTWGGWPKNPCRELSCFQPVDWAGMQTAWIYSQPFTVKIQPAFLVQFHYLPSLILYQPPGNQSSASISASTTYTQSYQADQAVAITDQGEYDTKTKSDLSFDPGFNNSGFTTGINETRIAVNRARADGKRRP